MVYEKRETLLSVKDVSLKLGGNQILRDINFEIKDIVRPDCITGQIVALIGQSGAGKSTLFSLLAGIRKPDTGTILQSSKNIPVKIGDMGVVYQNYYMFGWRKLRALFTAAASKNPSIKITDIKDAVEGIAADFNLTDHLDKFPSRLSGGQQQRAAIAEQILAGSEFLLLDEPFSGLDMIMIDKVMAILCKVSSYDELKTLVIVSHDIANTIAIADTVYILAREKDKPGGTITREIDLIERGLTWHKEIKDMPEFRDTLKEIKSLL
jgi:ABC-type nitrate/sulfonate/bicarbonate transport system ATPase subunit